MEDRTREKADELLDEIEGVDDIEITDFNLREYIRGDPTDSDSKSTGAEIEITCYMSHENEKDKSKYRVN